MTEEELKIFQDIKRTLHDSALADIKRARDAKSVIGTFILCSCFIEAMAGFKYGQDGRLKLGKTFRNFVEEYLPSYDKVSLYYDLRCQLVHNYSESKSYVFISQRPHLHLQTTGGNKKYINLENLVDDLELALGRLFYEIENDPASLANALKRYQKFGLA